MHATSTAADVPPFAETFTAAAVCVTAAAATVGLWPLSLPAYDVVVALASVEEPEIAAVDAAPVAAHAALVGVQQHPQTGRLGNREGCQRPPGLARRVAG